MLAWDEPPPVRQSESVAAATEPAAVPPISYKDPVRNFFRWLTPKQLIILVNVIAVIVEVAVLLALFPDLRNKVEQFLFSAANRQTADPGKDTTPAARLPRPDQAKGGESPPPQSKKDEAPPPNDFNEDKTKEEKLKLQADAEKKAAEEKRIAEQEAIKTQADAEAKAKRDAEEARLAKIAARENEAKSRLKIAKILVESAREDFTKREAAARKELESARRRAQSILDELPDTGAAAGAREVLAEIARIIDENK
jgi:hypothetical protein